MLEMFTKDGNLKQITESSDLDIKLNKNAIMIDKLPLSFRDSSFLFQVEKNITVGSVTIPQYTRGIFINNGMSNDMLMIAVDSAKYLYIGFRNNGKWTEIRKI